MRLFLLGGEHLIEQTESPALSGRRQRAVLEVLLVEANRPVRVERLIDELWPEEPPKTARNSVQRFVADVRAALGAHRDRLETTTDGYRLVLEAGELDLDAVHELRRQAKSADPAEASSALGEALAHFGDLAEDGALTPSGRLARLRHQELRLKITEEWVESELARDGGSEAMDAIDDLARRYPYREQFWSQLMRALDAQGRRVDALRAYETLRRNLADDIGVQPSAATRALEARLLSVDEDRTSPRIQEEPKATAASDHQMQELEATPAPSTLVGREEDRARLLHLVDEHRLVTVTGAGGVGKTALVLDLVENAASELAGAAVVRLAETATSERFSDVIATELGLTPEGNTAAAVIDEIVDHLIRTEQPIVLDNAEHVVAAASSFVERLLNETQCRIVVTSRQPLGVAAEKLLGLDGLELPDPLRPGQSDSETLFLRRAAAQGIDDIAAGPLASICDRLDGSPLAIELAAAQLAHLGVHDLADRLDSAVDAAAPEGERHSSLDQMIRWSWDLLSEPERALLQLLAVFHGRLATTAIEELRPQALPLVSGLVGKHLVAAERDDGRRYFSVSSSVRRFATREADRLGVLADLRDAHAGHVLAHMRQWSHAESNSWLDVIDEVARYAREYAPALEWLDERGRHDDVIDLATRVTGLWARRGPGADLDNWSRRVLDLVRVARHAGSLEHEVESAATVMALEARFRLGDYGRMVRYGERLVAIEERQPTDLGTGLLGFYGTAMYTFSLDSKSRVLVEQAVERARDTETTDLNVAQTLMWRGSCELMNREYGAATKTFTSVLRRTDRPSGTVLWSELGRVVALQLDDRRREAKEAIGRLISRAGQSIWSDTIEVVAAVIAADEGDVEGARQRLVAAARRNMGHTRLMARDDFQIAFGLVAAAGGEEKLAAELLDDAMGQTPVTATLLMHHQFPDSMSDEEWRSVWSGQYERRLHSAMVRYSGHIPSVDEALARWWPEFVDKEP